MKKLILVFLTVLMVFLSSCNGAGSIINIDTGGSDQITITSVFDVYSANKELAVGDGFACLVETPDKTILVDTPYKDIILETVESNLLNNLEKLEISPTEIDIMFITHTHSTTGIKPFAAKNPGIPIFSPDVDSIRLVAEMSEGTFRLVNGFEELAENIYSTTAIKGMAYGEVQMEQAMVVKIDTGLIMIVGCSHPGILNLVSIVNIKFPGEPIVLLYGGLHTKVIHKETEYKKILDGLADMGVQRLAPTHCSGDEFREYASKYKGIEYFDGGAGCIFNIN